MYREKTSIRKYGEVYNTTAILRAGEKTGDSGVNDGSIARTGERVPPPPSHNNSDNDVVGGRVSRDTVRSCSSYSLPYRYGRETKRTTDRRRRPTSSLIRCDGMPSKQQTEGSALLYTTSSRMAFHRSRPLGCARPKPKSTPSDISHSRSSRGN